MQYVIKRLNNDTFGYNNIMCYFAFFQLHFFFVNTLYPNINMHVLHIVLCTLTKVLTRRICITIKSFFSWLSFPLFSSTYYVLVPLRGHRIKLTLEMVSVLSTGSGTGHNVVTMENIICTSKPSYSLKAKEAKTKSSLTTFVLYFAFFF